MGILDSKNSLFYRSSKTLKIYFFLLFFTFSVIILALSYVMSQYLIENRIDNQIKKNLQIDFDEKQEEIKNFINSKQYYIQAIRDNPLLLSYAKDPDKHQEAMNNFLLSIATTSPDIMQLRFLDKKGNEKIKIARNNYNDTPFSINKTQLQNKSHRYYFQETLELTNNQDILFSKIDLNVEYGKVEKPFNPTLRIASAVFINNRFEGSIIINLFLEKFLHKITNSLYFQIALLNEQKEYIQHFNNPLKNWSAYSNTSKSFIEEFAVVDNLLIDQTDKIQRKYFIKDIYNLIPNNNISLVFTPKQNTYEQIKSIQKKYIFYLGILVFFLSIPISLLLAHIPFRYTRDLLDSKHRLLELVDENVLYSSSDLEGNIIDVSEALCRFTKFSKEELIGKNHNIFRHPDSPDEVFQAMWSTILKGHIWSGELKNVDKENNTFWINATITPNFKDNQIIGFTAIRENITDKKIIEALSITDELTSLYNKRYFNKTFPREIKRAKRLKTNFVFVILDIDNFKLYNDTYGHKEGDFVLQEVGVLLRKMFRRSYDYPFRIGGEEFAMIFFEKDITKIDPFIQKVKESVNELQIEHEQNADYKVVTVSIGYKVMDSDNILSETQIYKQADEALYAAKKLGRNRVVNFDNLQKTIE